MREPSCPMCGEAGDVTRVGHPTGEWLCSACPCTFNGGGQEYLDMGTKRATRQHHNTHGYKSLNLPTSFHPAQRIDSNEETE